MTKRGPMPTVVFEGRVYALTSRKTFVPNLEAMNRTDALLWLIRNTRARGYSKPSVRLPSVDMVGR